MNEFLQKKPAKYLVCALLVSITLAAYLPVVENNFINLDDPDYVMNNPHVLQGLTLDTVRWACFSFYSSNWHPLTWLSHALDCRLYGLNPLGHHLTNVFFHILNTVLLFLLLQNLTARRWASAFVALLFGIHPMHVESVAWVAERKDVLSGFFFLLTLLAYARYVELLRATARRRWLMYGLTLLLFALGLLSKPMLVTVPCVLLLLDFWPLGRFQLPCSSQPGAVFRRLALEKLPFFALSALSCWVTFLAQARCDSVVPRDAFPLMARLAHVPVAYLWYVGQLFWPTKLSFFYMLHVNQDSGEVAGALVLLLLITVGAVRLARKQPWLLVGWLWFLGMLVPVLGLLQVGNQAYANRYSYLPYIGIFIMLAWGIPALLGKWPYRKAVLSAGVFLVSVLCINLTIAQLHLWKNAETLYRQAIALDADNEEAWDLLGLQYMNQNDTDQAVACLRKATQRNPMFHQAWTSLGRILTIKGDYDAARQAFQSALAYADDKSEVYNYLGDLFIKSDQYTDAAASFETSLEFKPDQPEIRVKLGQSLVLERKPDQAAIQFEQAIQLQPGNPDAELGLATILSDGGKDAEAIMHYRKTVQLKPDSVIALNNLAWLLATAADPGLRNGREAVRLAERACQQTKFEQAFFIGTLAAAYAESGRYAEAVNAASKAQTMALAHGQKEVASKNGQLLELYQSGQPFHQEPHSAP